MNYITHRFSSNRGLGAGTRSSSLFASVAREGVTFMQWQIDGRKRRDLHDFTVHVPLRNSFLRPHFQPFAHSHCAQPRQYARKVHTSSSRRNYAPEESDMLHVLSSFKTDIRPRADGIIEVKECKLCSKGNRSNVDNLWKLGIWPTGGYNCFRCGRGGNWNDLKTRFMKYNSRRSSNGDDGGYGIGVGGSAGDIQDYQSIDTIRNALAAGATSSRKEQAKSSPIIMHRDGLAGDAAASSSPGPFMIPNQALAVSYHRALFPTLPALKVSGNPAAPSTASYPDAGAATASGSGGDAGAATNSGGGGGCGRTATDSAGGGGIARVTNKSAKSWTIGVETCVGVMCVTARDRDRQRKALTYLRDKRGLDDAVLSKYGVGVDVQQFLGADNDWEEHVCITFPWIRSARSLQDPVGSRDCSTPVCFLPPPAASDNNNDSIFHSDYVSSSGLSTDGSSNITSGSSSTNTTTNKRVCKSSHASPRPSPIFAFTHPRDSLNPLLFHPPPPGQAAAASTPAFPFPSVHSHTPPQLSSSSSSSSSLSSSFPPPLRLSSSIAINRAPSTIPCSFSLPASSATIATTTTTTTTTGYNQISALDEPHDEQSNRQGVCMRSEFFILRTKYRCACCLYYININRDCSMGQSMYTIVISIVLLRLESSSARAHRHCSHLLTLPLHPCCSYLLTVTDSSAVHGLATPIAVLLLNHTEHKYIIYKYTLQCLVRNFVRSLFTKIPCLVYICIEPPMPCRSLETKGLQRILPKGGARGFFGWHLAEEYLGSMILKQQERQRHQQRRMVYPEASNRDVYSNIVPSSSTDPVVPGTGIIVTEGEFDAMAVCQALSRLPPADPWYCAIPAVSLPNGCNSLPPELIDQLKPFEKVYLWLDFDKSGQGACDKFARKIGIDRCYIVRPGIDEKVRSCVLS